ncbi:MAG: chemotaxis protein CheW [Bacteriovorax sp.]|nr:chemotaxis protein CheW [Bacteriovorax sp.]
MVKYDVKKMKKNNSELSSFIKFSLGKEEYAISLIMEKKVVLVPDTSPIPKSPPHFLVIMNLHGQVIPMVDLRKNLKLEAKQDEEEAANILDIGEMNIGMVVDSINRVLAFSSDEVSETPKVGNQTNTNYISGVYRKDSSLTILLISQKS